MSEKRFILCQDDLGNYEIRYDDKVFHFLWEVAPILNEQQSTIQFLQDEIDELKKDIDIYKYEEKKHSESARKLYEENEQLKLKNDGLEFALKYIKKIDVEIDLNE